MSKLDPLNVNEKFLHRCAAEGMQFTMRALQPELQQLSKTKQQELIHEGFLIACKHGNSEAVEDILSDRFYGFINLNTFYKGLELALENNHIHVAQYALGQRFDSTQPAEEPFFSYNIHLFFKLFGNNKMAHTEAVEYLANYIETPVKQKDGKDFNLLSHQNYSLFKRACDFGNKSGAEFLINRYNISGDEPEIKKHLVKTQTKPNQTIVEHIKTLIRINLEKRMLEAEIGNGNSNKADRKINKV